MRQINTLIVVALMSILGLAACDSRVATTSVLPTPVSIISTATPLPTPTATATPPPTQTLVPPLTETPTAMPMATSCPTSTPGGPARQIFFSAAKCGVEDCEMGSEPSIYLIHSDGSGLRQVFQGQGSIQELVLSPDGAKLAFTENYGWGGYGVYILDLATGSAWPLMPDLPFDTRMPRWVSDDQLLCAARTEVSEGDYNIYLVDVDGERWQQLTDRPPHRGFYDLAVSPDGAQFLFAEYDFDAIRAAAYRMNVDGTGLRELISLSGDRPLSVGWSPSGNWMAIYPFPLRSTDPVPIYLADREGAEMVEIAQLTGYPQLLAWATDESELIFFNCSPTPETRFGNVVAVRRDGSGTRTVARVQGFCPSLMSLSPDQTQLAFFFSTFVYDLPSRKGLYVMDMHTGCQRQMILGYSVPSILWVP